MYNLIEYSSNYSKTARRLWLYFKDEANNFDNDIESAVSFNFSKYKAKLLENRDDQPTQIEALEKGVLHQNSAIAVPLNRLRNFWRSLRMLLISCKIQLKLEWTK